MRNILAFLAALALTVAGLGWYLGWYQVQTKPGGAGHQTLNIDINTEKAARDLHRAKEEVLDKGKEKLHDLAEKGKRADAEPPDGGARKDADKAGPSLLPPLKDMLEEQEIEVQFRTPSTSR
jgi:hypothetical protein